MEIASPSTLSIESPLERTKTVLNENKGSSFLSGGSSAGTSASVATKSISLSIKSISDVLGSVDVTTVGLDDLEGKKILVLDEKMSVYASPSNLSKNTGLKSIGSNSSIYGSLTSSTVINYFNGVVNGLSPFTKYVCWREDQYNYLLVYGDLSYENSRFNGSGKYIRLNVGNYSNDYTVSNGSIGAFGLSPGNYIVYSSFDGFPVLGGGVYEQIKILGLYVPFVFAIVWILFLCVPYRFKFKSREKY